SDITERFPFAEAIAINTDRESLRDVRADKKLYICQSVTKGEGTKGDSVLGKRCAQAHLEEIEGAIAGNDAVFIVAGMGGGTGTGAAPIIAEISRRLGIMTFTIAVDPFSFESGRLDVARNGIAKLKAICPDTIVVENDLMVSKMPDSSMRAILHSVNMSIASFIGRKVETIRQCLSADFDRIVSEVVKSTAGTQEMPGSTLMSGVAKKITE
ncbi:MAG: hypothetical protein E7Z67_02110, partial [Thermoplasmata archaeon]|nr:hypothetical protein [Thermoplasmata archaeon]